MPRLIGLELRLEVQTGPNNVREELAMIPLAIELPASYYPLTKIKMPCTLHASWGDVAMGFDPHMGGQCAIRRAAGRQHPRPGDRRADARRDRPRYPAALMAGEAKRRRQRAAAASEAQGIEPPAGAVLRLWAVMETDPADGRDGIVLVAAPNGCPAPMLATDQADALTLAGIAQQMAPQRGRELRLVQFAGIGVVGRFSPLHVAGAPAHPSRILTES